MFLLDLFFLLFFWTWLQADFPAKPCSGLVSGLLKSNHLLRNGEKHSAVGGCQLILINAATLFKIAPTFPFPKSGDTGPREVVLRTTSADVKALL